MGAPQAEIAESELGNSALRAANFAAPMGRDLEQYFTYLDGLAAGTQYSHLRTRLGPLFYCVPAASWLTSRFGLKPTEATKVFKAWKRSRNWVPPRKEPEWRKRGAP